jgi:hypothetical protein
MKVMKQTTAFLLLFIAAAPLGSTSFADPAGPVQVKKGTEPAWLSVTTIAEQNRATTYLIRVNKDKGIDVDKLRFALRFQVPEQGDPAFLIPVELSQDKTGLGAVLIVPEEVARKGILYLGVESREVKNGQASYVISMSSYMTIGDVKSHVDKPLGTADVSDAKEIEGVGLAKEIVVTENARLAVEGQNLKGVAMSARATATRGKERDHEIKGREAAIAMHAMILGKDIPRLRVFTARTIVEANLERLYKDMAGHEGENATANQDTAKRRLADWKSSEEKHLAELKTLEIWCNKADPEGK